MPLEDGTALDTLGSAIGVPIKIVPTISNDANGCYYKGVIYISLSADDKVMTVFSHELTHYLEDTLDYTEYKKCVLGFIQKNTDKSIDELVKEKVDTYAKSSINLTYEEATREIVADYTQNILKDADAVMEFVDSIENKEQRRGVIRRLLDAIKELINKIKAKFSSKHSQMQDLQKTHDLLENMLKETTENTESTLEVKQDIRLAVIRQKPQILLNFLVQKKWNSTAKKQKQYDQKQVGAEVLTENGDLRLTTLKWNLIKVELQAILTWQEKRNLK